VDGHHDALGAVLGRGGGYDVRVGDGGRIEAGLVGAGIEQAAHVFHRAPAAADGQRDEDLRGHGLDDVQDQVAAVAGGGDVQERECVGALRVAAGGDLHGVARVAQFHEVDALDHAAAGDVEAGDDAFREHAPILRTRSSACRPLPRGDVVGVQVQDAR